MGAKCLSVLWCNNVQHQIQRYRPNMEYMPRCLHEPRQFSPAVVWYNRTGGTRGSGNVQGNRQSQGGPMGQWKTNDLTKNGCFTSKNGDGFRFKAYNFVVDEHPNGGININEQQILPGCKQDYIDYMYCCGLFMWISKSLPFPWSAIGNPRLPAKNFWRWPIRIEWLLWSVWSSSYGMNIKYDHQ